MCVLLQALKRREADQPQSQRRYDESNVSKHAGAIKGNAN